MGHGNVCLAGDAECPVDVGGVLSCSAGELPLVRQFDLIERTKDFTVENATKSYFPQLSFSGKASYQSDVTKMPFSIPGVDSVWTRTSIN